uniref:AlNc14C308G10460 protein n=1 Tax=Albugo laibachii Nc14 TaxID=890382 RepID=F0WW10_9STRA|nr:AlNc14C308G10460 [Albugo laibachii Nc14]|eukprot:CCA25613.1 AlNc14C308G10460 [Albugo laibachii Nc14]
MTNDVKSPGTINSKENYYNVGRPDVVFRKTKYCKHEAIKTRSKSYDSHF